MCKLIPGRDTADEVKYRKTKLLLGLKVNFKINVERRRRRPNDRATWNRAMLLACKWETVLIKQNISGSKWGVKCPGLGH